MSEELRRENEELRATVEALRQEVEAAQRKASRALASYQQRALTMETVRQKNEELDRLTAELEAAKQAEEERARQLEGSNERLRASERENRELIARLQEAVAQLSTPILRVWSDVVALPIIGTIDEARAVAISQRTLEEVARGKIRHVVIDITGAETAGARTVQHLLGLARAVRLLGAHCVVCGLQPQVAREIVELGVELGGLTTARDLHVALAKILGRPAGS